MVGGGIFQLLANYGAQDAYLTAKVFREYFGWNDETHSKVWPVLWAIISDIIKKQLRSRSKLQTVRTDPSILPLEVFDHILSFVPHHKHVLSVVSKGMNSKIEDLRGETPYLDMFPSYRKELFEKDNDKWLKSRLQLFNDKYNVKLYKKTMWKGFIYCVDGKEDGEQAKRLKQALCKVEQYLKAYS